jgi:hypothetical protein
MTIPTSSFAIAIIYHNTSAALYSLVAVKIYLIVYGVVEYPGYMKDHLCKLCCRVCRYFGRN